MYKLRGYLPLASMLLMAAMAFGQGATAFEGQLKSANTEIWTYVKIALQIGFFVWTLFLLYQAFFSHDKQSAWWKIVAVVAFMAILQFFPQLYSAIMGTDSPVSAGGGTK